MVGNCWGCVQRTRKWVVMQHSGCLLVAVPYNGLPGEFLRVEEPPRSLVDMTVGEERGSYHQEYKTMKSAVSNGQTSQPPPDSKINVPLEKFKYHSQFGEFDSNFFSFEVIESIAKFLLERVKSRPKIGIICGSGLGSLADGLKDAQGFQYEDIPHFPVSTVTGHAGRLVFGLLENVEVICMQGRFHCYEGYPLWKCAMPVRLMRMIGVTHLIVTNAAGGLNPDYRIGDIMIIKDHINIMGFAGNSALNGPNDERFGPRFPAMNKAYDAEIRAYAKEIALRLGMLGMTHEGIYACLGGPNYETIAELRMLKRNGVDAVGMSTIPEVITAKHCGMTVFAFSLITNACILDYECEKEANHEEVVETGKQREPLLKKFVSGIVAKMHEKGTV